MALFFLCTVPLTVRMCAEVVSPVLKVNPRQRRGHVANYAVILRVNKRSETTTTTTTTEEAKTTMTTVTEKATTTTKAPAAKWLICVFGANVDPALVFPEDGLCDYHFYQAIERNGSFLEGKGAGPFFDTFTAAAAKHSKTEYGISLDYTAHRKTIRIVFAAVTTATISELWQKKIYHWGYLSTDNYSVKPGNVTTVFTILRRVKQIVDRVAKPPRPHRFFFRGTFTNDVRFQRNVDTLRRLFWLDAFLIVSHQSDDDRFWAAGRIVPPTFWVDMQMPDNAYTYSLATGHRTLDGLSKENINGTLMYLTASLGGRRYIPDDKNAYGGEVLNSDEALIVPIADYCKNKEYQFGFTEEEPIAPFYLSLKEKRFIAFDDERSLGIKFCRGKKKRSRIKYGVAIYDVEMDDPTNQCGKGAYKRLKFMRKLVDYMNNNFTSESAFERCGKWDTNK